MKYLGIDYGSKRIGLATSDDGGEFAFPLVVLENKNNVLDKVKEIITNEKIDIIILGESLDYKGKPNTIMKDIEKFKIALKNKVGLPVHLEPEFLTTAEAERLQEDSVNLDASAAALILKSYLSKKNDRKIF